MNIFIKKQIWSKRISSYNKTVLNLMLTINNYKDFRVKYKPSALCCNCRSQSVLFGFYVLDHHILMHNYEMEKKDTWFRWFYKFNSLQMFCEGLRGLLENIKEQTASWKLRIKSRNNYITNIKKRSTEIWGCAQIKKFGISKHLQYNNIIQLH